MQIWLHHYTLKRKSAANAVTKAHEQYGALIKIQDDEGNEGFSDLCPWPSLGDLTLDEELARKGPLYQRAIELAQADLSARKNKIKLVSANAVKNNILISNYKELPKDFDFSDVVVKIKADEHVYDLAKFLVENDKRFSKIRIDFNFCISELVFSDFVNLLSDEVIKKIEYIEDSFFFHRNSWNEFNSKIPLALDWKQTEGQEWNYRIWKPSREEKPECHNFSITSAMEHPVGLVQGLHFAQKYSDKTHGFLTLDHYEKIEFHQDFSANGDELVYNSDGYGIGFTTLLSKINWVPVFEDQSFLLCNHRLSQQEKRDLFVIKKQFAQNYILIPSSGSTQKPNETMKVIALSKQALMNSAKRVNREFQIDEASVWGCVLPLFHVGGLGIYLRAKAAGAKVCYALWEEFNLEWLNNNCITHLSLVPTQVFEIVQKNWQAPAFLKNVFVGSAELLPELAQKAQELGWPLVQTFGMTETASMIAVKRNVQDEFFETLPGVEIGSENGLLKIKSDSNADYILKLDLTMQKLIIEKTSEWITTSDQVEILGNKFKFLQRESDFVKIKGEGVSLSELRRKVPLMTAIIDVPDARDGNALLLVVKRGVDAEKILIQFNSQVRPYEKIQSWAEVDEIPVTDLGKIKYTQLKEIIKDLHVKKI